MDGSTFGYPDALNLGDSVSALIVVEMQYWEQMLEVVGNLVAGLKYLGLNIDIWGQSHLVGFLLKFQ